jgi:hypothetical protein
VKVVGRPVIRDAGCTIVCVSAVIFGLACCPSSASAQAAVAEEVTVTSVEHPLDAALFAARDSLRHIQTNILDYTAIMTKRCRVHGELSDYQQTFVKIRNRRLDNGRLTIPMSVYMKFHKPDAVRGREVIWVEGRNGGRLVAHDTGIKGLIRVNLSPTGAIAMRGQRYPITEVGLEKLTQKLIEQGERDRQHGECQVRFFDGAKVAERSCSVFQIDHPIKRSHFEFYRAHVFFDDELKILVRYASWSWPVEPSGEPVLEEEYTYTDVRINRGLNDLDFDPDNPAYDF